MIRATLKDRFRLTEQETRLVLRLLTGASLPTAAAALGIEYETARTHLKSVFSKTDTNRQAQLVIVVLRMIPADARDEVLNPHCPKCGAKPASGYNPATGECHNNKESFKC